MTAAAASAPVRPRRREARLQRRRIPCIGSLGSRQRLDRLDHGRRRAESLRGFLVYRAQNDAFERLGHVGVDGARER